MNKELKTLSIGEIQYLKAINGGVKARGQGKCHVHST